MSHYENMIAIWEAIGLPLRPKSPVKEKIKALIPSPDSDLLVMGVTPEFYAMADRVTALDISPAMIGAIWPGDGPGKQAVQGSWLDMPFADDSFDIVLSDGVMNIVSQPDSLDLMLREVRRVLRPGGRAIMRWFVAPEIQPEDAEIFDFAMNHCQGSIDAMRWRIVVHTAQCSDAPYIEVAEAYEMFERLFPDTEQLCLANDWDAETVARVRVYKDGTQKFHIPTCSEAIEIAQRYFPTASAHSSGNYVTSELFPLIVMENA